MGNPFSTLADTALRRYDRSDTLNYNKSRFLFNTLLIYSLTLLILPFFFLTVGFERFLGTIIIVSPFLTINLISFLLIYRVKHSVAASLIAVSAYLADTFIYFYRDPLDAVASFSFMILIIIVFAVLYSTTLISSLITAAYVISNGIHIYLHTHSTVLTPREISAIKTANIDSGMAAILIFVICFFTARFLNHAVAKSREESEKNREQYMLIKSLLETIGDVARKMSDSVLHTFQSADGLSESAQNQAAAIEEVSSTIEEISANATNASSQSKDQKTSMDRLIDRNRQLGLSIENLERYGQELSERFVHITGLAENGGRESALLDEINTTISDNSSQILSVVGIIEDFFERINLLALNASIEAARAGDQGRGFAVVADEIGKLSEHSALELKQITSIIEKNRSDVERGNIIIKNILSFITLLMDGLKEFQAKSVTTLREIGEQKEIKNQMDAEMDTVRINSDEIEQAMSEQDMALAEIVKSIDTTNNTIQEIAQNSLNLRKTAETLKSVGDDLLSRL